MNANEGVLSDIRFCLGHFEKVWSQTIVDFKKHQISLILARRNFAKDNIQTLMLVVSGILLGNSFKLGLITNWLIFGAAVICSLCAFILNLTYWQYATEKDIHESEGSYSELKDYFNKTISSLLSLEDSMECNDRSVGCMDQLCEIIKSPDFSSLKKPSSDDFLRVSNFLMITSLLAGFASLGVFNFSKVPESFGVLLILMLISGFFSFYSHKAIIHII